MAVLLALGYYFKQIGWFTADFIRAGKKFCFYVLLSSSLFKNLYDSDLDAISAGFIIFVIVAILAEFILGWITAHIIADRRNQKGVIIQGVVRSNFAYIGIPLATMMFTEAADIAKVSSEISIVSIFVIPLFNILAVIALVYYGDSDDDKIVKRTFLNLLKNPCIVSIACGLLVLLIRMIIPSSAYFIRDDLSFLYKSLSYLASMSTPLAFILVGASLDFSHSITNLKKLSVVVLLRTLICPVIVLSLAYLFKLASNAEYAILVSVFASPTAVASAIMAYEMGGDSDLANEIVIYTTVFSIISLLLIIYALKTMGCL